MLGQNEPVEILASRGKFKILSTSNCEVLKVLFCSLYGA
jgi:hypothetical protein